MSDIEARIQQFETSLPDLMDPDPRGVGCSLADRMAVYHVPGVSIALIDGGEVAWAKGYGVRAAGQPGLVDAETLFQAASISKPVAALAILRLFEARGLDPDADVNDYLTSWRVPPVDGWQPRLTLRRLLSHSAGTTVHGFQGYRHDEPVPTVPQILDGLKPANSDPVRVALVPGVQFRYSGGGTTIAQQLAEDIAGQPFADFVREWALEPLGMTWSAYAQPLPPELHANAAHGHYDTGTEIEGAWFTMPELAAAGLWTTPTDIARFGLALRRAYRGEASPVSQPVARWMLTEVVKDAEFALGMGPFLYHGEGTLQFGHGGSNVGYKNDFRLYAEGGDSGYAIMTNGDYGVYLMKELVAGLAKTYGWDNPVPAVVLPLPADCAGTYTLDSGLSFTVAASGDGFTLQPDGQPALDLHPLAGATFRVAALRATVTFGQDGTLVLAQNGREFTAKRG